MPHLVTRKNVVELSTPAKNMRAPKWSFWAENGFIHVVDEDIGAYYVMNRIQAQERLEGMMAIFKFTPSAHAAIDDLDVAHKEEIKALFKFNEQFTELLKRAEEQEDQLYQKFEAAANRRNSRIFVPEA